MNAVTMSSAGPQIPDMTFIPDTHNVDSTGTEMAEQINRLTPSSVSVAYVLPDSTVRVAVATKEPFSASMSTTRIFFATSKTGDTRPFQTGIAILIATAYVQPLCQQWSCEGRNQKTFQRGGFEALGLRRARYRQANRPRTREDGRAKCAVSEGGSMAPNAQRPDPSGCSPPRRVILLALTIGTRRADVNDGR